LSINQNHKKLNQLIKEIEEIRKYAPFSSEFKVWRSSVERFLGRIWKDEPEYLEHFKKIEYGLRTIIPEYEMEQQKKARKEIARTYFFQRLREAELLLKSFLDEIPNYESPDIKEKSSNPLEKEKIQKLLTSLKDDLTNANLSPDRNTFGFKHSLKEIFKNLYELEPKIFVEYTDIDKLSPLESYDTLDYTRGDSGMAQLLKSRIDRLLIETSFDGSQQFESITNKNLVLENILEKFPRVVRQLQERRKENGEARHTLTIKDEYDVQDLLCSILKINFEIVKKEIGTEYHAGGSARMDLVLDDEEIVIEVKMVRKNHTLRDLADELIIDIERYLQKYSCKFLYFFIYDPANLLPNLPELVRDIDRTTDGVVVRVIFSPVK
jgi:hypothetical protein